MYSFRDKDYPTKALMLEAVVIHWLTGGGLDKSPDSIETILIHEGDDELACECLTCIDLPQITEPELEAAFAEYRRGFKLHEHQPTKTPIRSRNELDTALSQAMGSPVLPRVPGSFKDD